ncbi:MAG: hypothetical protein AAF941_08275 [Pseudomonadota bacterium]
MILPLAAFMLIDQPDMSVTESPPFVFRIPDPTSETPLAELEFCTDTVTYVDISFDELRREFSLQLTLAEEAGRRLGEITAEHVGTQSQVVIGGEVIISPRINSAIWGGSLSMTGGDSIAQLEQMRQAARGHCSLPKAETE